MQRWPKSQKEWQYQDYIYPALRFPWVKPRGKQRPMEKAALRKAWSNKHRDETAQQSLEYTVSSKTLKKRVATPSQAWLWRN